MKIDGAVKNVTDFGAFTDLGGADGLLHILRCPGTCRILKGIFLSEIRLRY